MQAALFNLALSFLLLVLLSSLRNICFVWFCLCFCCCVCCCHVLFVCFKKRNKQKSLLQVPSGRQCRFCLFTSRERWLLVEKQEHVSGKNCMQWASDIFFVHSHLITVASVIECNKTENPINSPPGAVLMVFVHCWGELTSGFSWAGGYWLHLLNIWLGSERCWLYSFKGRKQHENKKKAQLKVASSSRGWLGSAQFNLAWQFTL